MNGARRAGRSPRLAQTALRVLERLEGWLPELPRPVNWSRHRAAVWRRLPVGGRPVPGPDPAALGLDDLVGIEAQKAQVLENLEQFVAGLPANHMLFWGTRGAGKSSLVHAVLGHFAPRGLRLLEVDREDLGQIPDIALALRREPYRFLVFCDDLTFEAHGADYKALKRALDGSVFRTAPNMLVVATSNRRHLLPERASDNGDTRILDGELHPGEAVDERISLSDRFGLWIPFHPFRQATYLEIVRHWVAFYERTLGPALPVDDDGVMERAALQWAMTRGHRSGRAANHFARHWVGRRALQSSIQRSEDPE